MILSSLIKSHYFNFATRKVVFVRDGQNIWSR